MKIWRFEDVEIWGLNLRVVRLLFCKNCYKSVFSDGALIREAHFGIFGTLELGTWNQKFWNQNF
jgi:hypothetical protein